jgi:hypothetical protein
MLTITVLFYIYICTYFKRLQYEIFCVNSMYKKSLYFIPTYFSKSATRNIRYFVLILCVLYISVFYTHIYFERLQYEIFCVNIMYKVPLYITPIYLNEATTRNISVLMLRTSYISLIYIYTF